MFRVINELLKPEEKPHFLIMCDNRNCRTLADMNIDITSQEQVNKDQMNFLGQATKDGWLIGLDGQFCPFHAERFREMVKEKAARENRVIVPGNGITAGLQGGSPLDRVLLNRRIKGN